VGSIKNTTEELKKVSGKRKWNGSRRSSSAVGSIKKTAEEMASGSDTDVGGS